MRNCHLDLFEMIYWCWNWFMDTGIWRNCNEDNNSIENIYLIFWIRGDSFRLLTNGDPMGTFFVLNCLVIYWDSLQMNFNGRILRVSMENSMFNRNKGFKSPKITVKVVRLHHNPTFGSYISHDPNLTIFPFSYQFWHPSQLNLILNWIVIKQKKY